MSRKLLAVFFAMLCSPLCAQTVGAPVLKAGDSWIYTDTTQKGTQGWVSQNVDLTVERVDSDGLLIASKQDGSTQPPVERITGIDWSRSRDINGKQQVVNRPLDFPLREGKKWQLEYTELNPNPAHSRETFQETYVVTDWEDIKVPAGTFKAIKIEANGEWTAVLAPNVVSGTHTMGTTNGALMIAQSQRTMPRTVSGKLYKAFWYVPAEKRFVKSIQEYYSSNGIRSERYTEELVSSKLTN